MGQSTSGRVASFAPLLTSMDLSDDDDNSERVAELQAAAEAGAKKKRLTIAPEV